MSPTLRKAVLLASLLPLRTMASETPVVDDAAEFPERVIESVVEREGDDAPSLSDEVIRQQFLVDPSSPYSALKTSTDDFLGGAWSVALQRSGLEASIAFEVFTRHMGLTKAVPGVDVTVHSSYANRDPFIGAQATKAAVDADIYAAALDYTGFYQSALAANYAVGAQIVRDMLKRVPEERHAELNLRADVLQRFLTLRQGQEIDEYDANYLEQALQGEIMGPTPGRSPSLDVPYIPAQFRVARLAAAYHDASGYFTVPPCQPSGRFRPKTAGTGVDGDTRALCFVDATDQDVYRWYLKQFNDQAAGIKRYPDQQISTVSRLLEVLRPVALMSDIIGFGSFISYTTGIRASAKNWIKPDAVSSMRKRINSKMCRF